MVYVSQRRTTLKTLTVIFSKTLSQRFLLWINNYIDRERFKIHKIHSNKNEPVIILHHAKLIHLNHTIKTIENKRNMNRNEIT